MAQSCVRPARGCSACFVEPSQPEVDLGSINSHKMSS